MPIRLRYFKWKTLQKFSTSWVNGYSFLPTRGAQLHQRVLVGEGGGLSVDFQCARALGDADEGVCLRLAFYPKVLRIALLLLDDEELG